MSTKRTVELAEKLALRNNIPLLSYLPAWIRRSETYADTMIERQGFTDDIKDREGYQLLYCLNHLCPSLYHYKRKPSPEVARKGPERYNREMAEYIRENSQACFTDETGTVVQEGVVKDKENFIVFCKTTAAIYGEKIL